MSDEAIQVFGNDEARALFAELGRQAPFAASLTLNGLANSSQALTKEQVKQRFILRRPTFVLNTIYRKRGEDFATKKALNAAVRVDDRRDFLAKFETGGTKGGVSGHRIGIPIDVRRNKNDIITTANKPRNLLLKPKVSLFGSVIRQSVGRGRNAASKLLYILKRSVKIPDRLDMRENAETAVRNDFDRIAGEAIDRALATARK